MLKFSAALGATALAAAAIFGYQHFHVRYQFSAEMIVPIEEVTTAEYPEDPAGRSIHYGEYNGRTLRLIQHDDAHFDFVFEPQDDRLATIAVRNVDVSLMTPRTPEWCRDDDNLVRIALTDREWNRQQVWFERDGGHVEVTGGDGFEEERLDKVALAKNCLNAGLWEIILAVEENGGKAMYYQGWFTFPMGHYRRLVEAGSDVDYGEHWHYLEHWFDPAGAVMDLDALRTVKRERETNAKFDPEESLIVAGEQVRKKRTCNGPNLTTWGNVLGSRDIEFAAFIPPGRYSVDHPWNNEYWRLAKFEKVILRDVTSPASGDAKLTEIELIFESTEGEPQRFIVGGVDLAKLQQLPTGKYPEGMYMPMGIGVPPFYQSYEDLTASPPHESPYYSFLLDDENRWIDHHKAAVDGPR